MPMKWAVPQWVLIGLVLSASAAEPPAGADKIEEDKKALAPIKACVGEWRGSGTLKGGAQKDAWSEEATWAWDFKEGRAALVYTQTGSRYLSGGRLEAAENGAFRFTGTLPDGKTKEEFKGQMDKEGDLVLTSAAPAEGRPARLTLSIVAKGKRLVMLYQRKERRDSFAPMAEVGLTLKGSGFGKQSDARECIITGGLGTISVTHKGQTYYVCCTGCRDAFLENPEKELASYRKRKEEEKKKE